MIKQTPIRSPDTFKNSKSVVDFHFYYKNAFSVHAHDFYELFMMTKGRTLHSLNNQLEIAEKKMVAILRPSETHQAFPYQNEESEHLTISITKEAFRECCDAFSADLFYCINNNPIPICFYLSDVEFDYILSLSNIVNTLPTEKFEQETTKISKLIFSNLLFHFNNSSTIYSLPDWLNIFLSEISSPKNFDKRLKELYALAPYSQSVLNNYFQKYIGKTIISYITDVKINYARNLLSTTNYSILYIAGLLGYESLAHFNRTFKRLTGIPPNLYRKNALAKNN